MPDDARREARRCDGVGALAERYDGFLLDQFGVLHDGRHPYPGVAECLDRLMALGKAVIVLSNSGKRAAPNARRLAALGIGRGRYTELVTSGEVVWRELASRSDPFYGRLGRRCLLVSGDGDRSLVDGLDLEVVHAADQADFVLLAGVEAAATLDQFTATLEYGSAHGLPLVCANPDLVQIAGDRLGTSSGALARHYELLGGPVRYVGKPFPEIYAACRRILAERGARRALCAGDSLLHDVSGGAEAGFDTMFVTGGIHRSDFADAPDDAARSDRLRLLVEEYGVAPDWVIEALRW
jgi:HAD superfamily hydrolase (TIGR01459 family)